MLIVALLAAAPSVPAAAQDDDTAITDAAVHQLSPGQYLWEPDAQPDGTMTMVVSLPSQRASVYRDGVRIGATTVSTGKAHYRTPAGVFKVLQKERMHHSNKYENAPMPYMQRISWSGLALHAGHVRAHPSSHGCVRLPMRFSEALFGEHSMGMKVIITRRDDTRLEEATLVAQAPQAKPKDATPKESMSAGLFSPVTALFHSR